MRAAAIIGSGLANEDAAGLELLQPVRKDVGGDTFTGALELAKRAVAAHHHVPDDEQGPAIPEKVEGNADWASRTAFRTCIPSHAKIVSI